MKINFYRKHKLRIYLFLILLLAFSLQIIFFIGFSNHPSDEGIIIGNSYAIYQGNFNSILSEYKNLRKDGLYDPSEAFRFRPLFLYPIAFFWRLFGINDYSTVLWVMITYLGTIVVTYKIGENLFNKKVGLISAFLISICPLQLLYSTRVSIDTPLAFFMGLSVFFFIKGNEYLNKTSRLKQEGKNSRKYFLLSGLCLGFGYLTKISALPLFGFFFLYFIYKKRFNRIVFWLILGFIIIFVVESLYYYIFTNHFFIRVIMNKGFIENKIIHEPTGDVTFLNLIKISYLESSPFFYLEYITGKASYIEYPYPRVEIFCFFILLSTLYFIFHRKESTNVLLIWLIILFLWLEFGPASIKFSSNYLIEYWVIQKHDRYMMIILIPSILILSNFLYSLKDRAAQLIILMTIVIFSIYFVNISSKSFNDVLSDVRDAYNFLRYIPNKTIYCDGLCVSFLDYYFGFKNTKYLNFVPINITDENIVKNSYVIVGGSRTFGICCIENMQPKFIDNKPPDNWELIKTFKKEKKPWRDSNMSIYYVNS